MFSASIMILVAFTALSGGARAADAEVPAVADGGTVYGPGQAVTPLPDGKVRVEYRPTFQRWDGAWRPMSALNRSTGEWPYLVEETESEIRVTRLGRTFTQAKLSDALYEFLPQGVKETIVVRQAPPEALVSIPFTATYGLAVEGNSILLRDPSGTAAWETGSFHAWDSADPPRTWSRAITSIAYVDGRLKLGLDPAMLSTARFPLYVDPTWITNASMGWPSVGLRERENAAMDFGDSAFKIGWFADNFDDGTKDFIWTTDSGSWTISGGAAQLDTLTRIRNAYFSGSTVHWNTSFQAKITFTGSGAAKMIFRWIDASNYHYLDISEAADQVTLKKVVSGSTTALGSAAKTIATNQAYPVKIVAKGGSFTVLWGGSVLLTATDPSSPLPPAQFSGDIGFETYGRRTKLAVDDVRAWAHGSIFFERAQENVLGVLWTPVRNAVPQAVRTVHSASSYHGVDLWIQSFADGYFDEYPHYVKAGAKSKTSDAEAYYVQDADRKPYYRLFIDLRSTDDFSPALTEIAVIEGGASSASENAQVLGYEPWQYYVGGTVNVVSGNLFLGSTDLTLPGKGWTLAFARAYNSLSSVSGPLGPGWTHAYNVYLTAGTGTVSFTDGDGSTHVFEDMGGGLYASPRGLGGAKLVKNADGTYAMSWKDGSTWSFSSAGKLAQMKDRNGNKVALTYDGNGRLTKAADDSGIFLMFAYDANGRIVRVTDHNGTFTQANPGGNFGLWLDPWNAATSNNLYARSKTASNWHVYQTYGLSGPSTDWITKVEVCVEAYTAGDDDLGVKISTNLGSTWSTEQVVNLPSADPNALTCLDFTSHLPSWSWTNLSNSNFRVQVRYVKVGGAASFDYLDWIPVRVSTASRFVSYAYDPTGNLASVADPMGNSTLYSYAGILEKAVDRADKVLRFVKDASSRVTEVWTGQYSRGSGTIPWEFRTYGIAYGGWSNRNASVTDASGNVTAVEYDALAGRPVRIDGPLAASGGGCSCCGAGGNEKGTIEWDGEHNWVTKTDGRSLTTKAEYDWRGDVVWIWEAVIPGGAYAVSSENIWRNRDNGTVFDSLLVTRVDKREFATTYEYDWKGNLVKTADPLGNFTENFYDAAGFLTKVTDKRGDNTTFTYDVRGRRLTRTDSLGHTSLLAYDAVGRMVARTTPLGFVTRYVYNGNDWLVSTTDPLNHATRFMYNARGDRIAFVDANGNRTDSEINATCGCVQKIVEPTGHVTENAYDKLGRLVQVKDPNGKVWGYEYDKFGRRTKEIDPLGHASRFSYDKAGNLVTRIDGRGRYTNYTYDAENRLSDVFYQDNTGPSFGYDENGNVVQEWYYFGMGSPSFVKDTVYDALNRPVRLTFDYGAFIQTVEYAYDGDGNRRTMTYPGGFAVAYAWDEDDRLVNLQIPDHAWTFLYDDDHRRTAVAYPNGLQTNYTYDAAGRLTAIRTVDTSNWTVLEGYTSTYDNVGNQLTQGQSNGTVLSYAYNEDSSLNATAYEAGATSYYVYDANGNRLYKNWTNGLRETYTYNNDTSLARQEVRSGSDLLMDVTYGYDKNGNLLSKVENTPGREPVRTGYAYDFENKLTQVAVNGAEVSSYAYAADGSRIRRTESGSTTYFLYDPRDFNGFEDILGELNETGALKTRYVHGPGIDEPLAKFDKKEVSQGAWYYYHFDGRGSVTMLTRADRSVANRQVYDDFGAFRERTEAIPNSYGFTGRESDILGLTYYRARYFDADTGRFIQRDPAGLRSGSNLYAYADNSPVTHVDPSGLVPRRSDGAGSTVSRCTDAERAMMGYACDLGITTIGLACLALGPWGAIACGIGVGIVGAVLCEALISSYCGEPFRWLSASCDVVAGEICMKIFETKLPYVGIALGLFLCPLFSTVVCGLIPK